VQRRYNEFLELKRRLDKVAPRVSFPHAPFPKKHSMRCCGRRHAAREARRGGLESWLGSVLRHTHTASLWACPLHSFLLPGRVQVSRERPAAAALAPQPGWPSAATQSEEVEILVPTGVSSGETISVTTPDGRHMPFVLPALIPPAGFSMRLWYDPAGPGHLTALESPPGCEAAGGQAAGSPDASGQQTLQITVPEGARGGEALLVAVPDGRHVPLALPAQALPGATLNLWYDARTGVISLM